MVPVSLYVAMVATARTGEQAYGASWKRPHRAYRADSRGQRLDLPFHAGRTNALLLFFLSEHKPAVMKAARETSSPRSDFHWLCKQNWVAEDSIPGPHVCPEGTFQRQRIR